MHSNKSELSLVRVSVVIPAYNAADYLCEAIDSVLSQDYPNIELIVLDDGSTDHTREILESYPEGSFYWESHANIGQAATLNKGWAMAQGEVLGYLSADDILLYFAVTNAVHCLESSSAVAVYGDYQLIDEKGNVTGESREVDFSYKRMISHSYCPIGPGAFFRRSEFEDTGGWNVSLRQIPDYDFWLRIGRLGEIRHIPKLLSQWRIHAASQTNIKADVAKADEISKVINAFFRIDRLPQDIIDIRFLAQANAHIFSASLHLRAGRSGTAFNHIREAYKLNPKSFLSNQGIKRILGGMWFYMRILFGGEI